MNIAEKLTNRLGVFSTALEHGDAGIKAEARALAGNLAKRITKKREDIASLQSVIGELEESARRTAGIQ